MEREAAVASLSEPHDPGRRLRLKARVAPGADPLRLRDAFAGGASCLLSAMMADEPLEGARHRRSFHDAASGDLMVDFQVIKAVATALAAQLEPDGTISLPEPWGALAAVEWPDQPRRTRVRVVNVPAELQLRHVRQLLTKWGCIVEECKPVLNPQLGEGKIRRASAVEVVLAQGSKVPATLQCQEYPQTLMRLDILTSPAPLRLETTGDVTAGKRTFAAAVAANAGQHWTSPRPRQHRRQAPRATGPSRGPSSSQAQPPGGRPGQAATSAPQQPAVHPALPGSATDAGTPSASPAPVRSSSLETEVPSTSAAPIQPETTLAGVPTVATAATVPTAATESTADGELSADMTGIVDACPADDGFKPVKTRSTRNRATMLPKNTRAGGRTLSQS